MKPEKYESEYTMVLEDVNGNEYAFIDYALRQCKKLQKEFKKLLSKPENFPANMTAEETLLDAVWCKSFEMKEYPLYKQKAIQFLLSDAFDLLRKYDLNPDLSKAGVIEKIEAGLNHKREYLEHREEEIKKGNDVMDKLFLQAQLSLLTQIRSQYNALDAWSPEGALKFRDYLNSEYHGMIEKIASMIEDPISD